MTTRTLPEVAAGTRADAVTVSLSPEDVGARGFAAISSQSFVVSHSRPPSAMVTWRDTFCP